MSSNPGFELISTCPESGHEGTASYLERVRATSRWCEDAGHSCLLLHSEHRLFDAWVLAQEVLGVTRRLRPIVSVQPLYMHPYTVAKKVGSLARMFGRAPDLNLVAGGCRADLLSLNDVTPHDARYRRLVEYATVIQSLLGAQAPVCFHGEFYALDRPRTLAPLPEPQRPSMYIAGTSEAGRAAADLVGARSVGQLGLETLASDCVRLGIVTREDDRAAWDAARRRFPCGRGSRLQRRLEVSLGDSSWQQGLDRLSDADADGTGLWLQPYASQRAPCAYLVGSYRLVARRLVDLLQSGTRSFFLDCPPGPEELEHIGRVFDRAWSRFGSPLSISGGTACGRTADRL